MTLQSASADMGPWFHNLHLPDGTQTAPDHPLGDFPAYKWRELARCVPSDLTGARALDIGCNAGYYSFELAARGARVLAIDLDEHYLRQARWAAGALDPHGRVEFRRAQVYDLAEVGESFDLILFLGVLYHLRYPQLALDLVASRVAHGGRLIFQTLTMPGAEPVDPPDDVGFDKRERLLQPGWPRAAFVERSLADDPTNWWVLDDACVQALLRSAGMRVIGRPGAEIYVAAPDPDNDHAAFFREPELAAALRRSSRSSRASTSGSSPSGTWSASRGPRAW